MSGCWQRRAHSPERSLECRGEYLRCALCLTLLCCRCLEVCKGELTVEKCSFVSEMGSAVMSAGEGSVVMKDCKLAGCGRCGLICVHSGKAHCVGCDLSQNALNGKCSPLWSFVLWEKKEMDGKISKTGIFLTVRYSHTLHNSSCASAFLWRRGTARRRCRRCLADNALFSSCLGPICVAWSKDL